MRLGLHVLEECGAANPGGPSMWCNTQVTYSPSPDNARSESELETNPLNPLNVVGASKRFIDPKRTTSRSRPMLASTAASPGRKRPHSHCWTIRIPIRNVGHLRPGHRVGRRGQL